MLTKILMSRRMNESKGGGGGDCGSGGVAASINQGHIYLRVAAGSPITNQSNNVRCVHHAVPINARAAVTFGLI